MSLRTSGWVLCGVVGLGACSASSGAGVGASSSNNFGSSTSQNNNSSKHNSSSNNSSSQDNSSSPNNGDGGSDSGSGFCATSNGVAAGYTAVALACKQDTPSGLAVQNGIVYWTNYDAAANSGNASGSGGAIMSVPTSGGTPTTVVPDQDYPWAITVDSNNIYWTNYDNDGAVSGGTTEMGTVLQSSLNGGNVITLASTLEDPYGIAVDASNVYFTTYAGGRVKKVPIGGGSVTVLAENLNNPCYLAVIGGNLYWTNYGDGTVQTIPTSGTAPGTPTTLATDAAGNNANGIAVSGSTVFFAASNDPGAIWTIPTTGGAKPSVIANKQDNAWGLTVHGGNVYWTNNDSPGELVSVPMAGGTTTTLATFLDDPTAVAADGTGVYTAGDGGHIWRISQN